jgi:hypothetical protein
MDTVEIRDLVVGTRVWLPDQSSVWAAGEVVEIFEGTNQARIEVGGNDEELASPVEKAVVVVDLRKTQVFLRNEAILCAPKEVEIPSTSAWKTVKKPSPLAPPSTGKENVVSFDVCAVGCSSCRGNRLLL